MTSIGTKALNALRMERSAEKEAVFILNQPDRLEELQQRIDGISTLVRNFVAAKYGNTDPIKLSKHLQQLMEHYSGTPMQKESSEQESFMNPENLCRVLLTGMSISISNEEADALFDRFDANENGTVSNREFCQALMGCSICQDKYLDAKPAVRQLIKRIKGRMLERSVHTNRDRCVREVGFIRSFKRSFQQILVANKGRFSKEELLNGLQTLGVRTTLNEIGELLKAAGGSSNQIQRDAFLRIFRGAMSRSRRLLVSEAYNILDSNRDESITLVEIAAKFDVSKHPNVISGHSNPKDVLRDFMALWDKDGDAIVTFREFLDVYKDLSAEIDNDEYFMLMMRNVWHLSGEGNTTNRRVLVTFANGSQRIEELKEDLGSRATDTEKILAQLTRQGVRDVLSVEVYS